MRARARLRIDGAGRVVDLVDDPPVAWRPTPQGVFIVGTAGGLTGDDDIGLDVDVAAGGHLTLRSTAATVVYSGGAGTVQRVRLGAAARAVVDWRPEPVIVTAGAVHAQTSVVRVADSAALDWTELVVLGRAGEEPGRAELRLDCVVVGPAGAAPLLRHHLAVGPGAGGWNGPAVVGSNRAVGVRLRAGPDLPPPPRLQGTGWSWMRLAGPGWLLTTVAADLPELLERMAAASP